MTLTAHCPRCGCEFTFNPNTVRFAASLFEAPDGSFPVLARYYPHCPECQTEVAVPYTRPSGQQGSATGC